MSTAGMVADCGCVVGAAGIDTATGTADRDSGGTETGTTGDTEGDRETDGAAVVEGERLLLSPVTETDTDTDSVSEVGCVV